MLIQFRFICLIPCSSTEFPRNNFEVASYCALYCEFLASTPVLYNLLVVFYIQHNLSSVSKLTVVLNVIWFFLQSKKVGEVERKTKRKRKVRKCNMPFFSFFHFFFQKLVWYVWQQSAKNNQYFIFLLFPYFHITVDSTDFWYLSFHFRRFNVLFPGQWEIRIK